MLPLISGGSNVTGTIRTKSNRPAKSSRKALLGLCYALVAGPNPAPEGTRLRRFFSHSKILYSLLAVMLAIALVPLAIVSWRLITINRTSLLETQRAMQLEDARSHAREVAVFVNGFVDRTAGFAHAFEVAGSFSTEGGLVERLAEPARRDSSLVAFALVPAGGQPILARGASQLSDEEVSRLIAEGVSGARESEPFLGPVRRAGDGAMTVAVASDTVSIGGRAVGHVVTVIDLAGAFPFVSSSRPQEHGAEAIAPDQASYFIVDDQGLAIVDSESPATGPRDMRDNPLVRAWLAQPEATSDLSREFEQQAGDGTAQMLGALATADLAGGRRLGVASVVNRDVAMAPANRMTTQTIWASLIVAFVTVLVSILFAGYIANPIKELATGARAMADGDFSRRIRVWSNNETGQLARDFNRMADRLSSTVEEMREAAVRNHDLFIGTVRGLAAAIDGKDPYTRGHSERVAEFSSAMAIELGLSEEEVEKIRISGLMHDVGKLAIEDKILRKPAALTDEEFEIMREHPERGTKIMSEIPHMREFIPGMRFHHEMVNGKGYPLGLEGDQIPLMARIVSVADTFDAMTTNRPYQKQMPIDLVFEKIRDMAGIRYDPEVVEALIRAYDNGRIRLRMQKSAAGLTQ